MVKDGGDRHEGDGYAIWAEIGSILWRPEPLDFSQFEVEPMLDRPFLDVGPGHGWEVRDLMKCFPELSILAVEPNIHMRIALVNFLAGLDGEAARNRVTIFPLPVEDAPLKANACGGALVQAVAYSIMDQQRFWTSIRAALTFGAPLVVSKIPSSGTKESVPNKMLGSGTHGLISYERWYERTADTQGATSTNTYVRALADGAELCRDHTTSKTIGLTDLQLTESVGQAGFTRRPDDYKSHWLFVAT